MWRMKESGRVGGLRRNTPQGTVKPTPRGHGRADVIAAVTHRGHPAGREGMEDINKA